MALRPVIVDKRSPFLGEACALCKQPLAPGDELAICPEDATRHHARCWVANGNRCTAYGCDGQGELAGLEGSTVRLSATSEEANSKVQTLPARGFHCAQSCLVVAIAVALILFAVGCFGLWAIADYIMIEVLGWHYRDPVVSMIPLLVNHGNDLHLALGASLAGIGLA
jgi:hypothetical protein